MATQDQPVKHAETSPHRPGAASLQVRAAVRTLLDEANVDGPVGVAVSGGADSLALAAAATATGREVHAVVVDHGLQEGSSEVAEVAAIAAHKLGVTTAKVVPVQVTGRGGLEAAARRARYAALIEALPNMPVLLGHTRDDQAETVLLGLGRGSGPRSIAGMRPIDWPWLRPLLDVPRSVTVQSCAELGVEPWQDPHNSDPSFTRVRLRSEVIPLLDDVLQGGVVGALARTAKQVREDLEALDALAEDLLSAARLPSGELDVDPLAAAHPAIRRRALRRWLLDLGARDLTEGHLRAVDELVGRWRGQGGVWLPGDLVAARARGRLALAGSRER